MISKGDKSIVDGLTIIIDELYGVLKFCFFSHRVSFCMNSKNHLDMQANWLVGWCLEVTSFCRLSFARKMLHDSQRLPSFRMLSSREPIDHLRGIRGT